MKKHLRIVEMRLIPTPSGERFQLSLVDYKPETEKVDRRAELEKKILAQLPKDIPPDIAKSMAAIAMVSLEDGAGDYSYYSGGNAFVSSHILTLSKKDVEELGPALGSIISVDVEMFVDA